MPPIDARPGPLVAPWNIDTAVSTTIQDDIIDSVDCNQYGIEMPSAFSGTVLGFMGENDPAGTFLDIYENGTLLAITVGASQLVSLTESQTRALRPYRYLKIKTVTGQAADRAGFLHMTRE